MPKLTVKPELRWMSWSGYIRAARQWNEENPDDPIDLSGISKEDERELTSDEAEEAIDRFYKMFDLEDCK